MLLLLSKIQEKYGEESIKDANTFQPVSYYKVCPFAAIL